MKGIKAMPAYDNDTAKRTPLGTIEMKVTRIERHPVDHGSQTIGQMIDSMLADRSADLGDGEYMNSVTFHFYDDRG